MIESALRSPHSSNSVRLPDLERFAQGWVLDGQYRQLAPQTLEARKKTLQHLCWWLRKEGLTECDTFEIRGFLHYVGVGHLEPGGRWGIPTLVKPVRPRTVKDTFGLLRSFFSFLVNEGYLEASPMQKLKSPIHRPDQMQPFSENQVKALLDAAKKSRHPKRDEALLLFMLDTGVRASELCGLTLKSIDIVNRKAMVLGKGNKHRAVYFGRETGKALWQYIRDKGIEGTDPLFRSEKGGGLQRSGLRQLFERLGIQANIEATRCSPHTLRHTFAVMFLRGGGSVFSLKELLGHTISP